MRFVGQLLRPLCSRRSIVGADSVCSGRRRIAPILALVLGAILLMAFATPAFAAGTLVDNGFESGVDGAALASPPWTVVGTPQHAEYDNALAKVGTQSAWLKGPAAAGSAGIAESASSGMTTNGSEIRFWLNCDTANEVRYLYDLGATAQAFTIRLGGDGTIATYTNAGKNMTPASKISVWP